MATSIPYQSEIAANAQADGLQPSLLASLLNHESGFNATATHANANGSVDRGIAQINNQAHPNVTTAQANNPYFAIPWAANYLSSKVKGCGSVAGGLQAYNSGSCSGDTAYSNAIIQGQTAYAGLPGGSGSTSGQSFFGLPVSQMLNWGLIGILVIVAFIFILEAI